MRHGVVLGEPVGLGSPTVWEAPRPGPSPEAWRRRVSDRRREAMSDWVQVCQPAPQQILPTLRIFPAIFAAIRPLNP